MKLFIISILISVLLLTGCAPSPQLQFNIIENYPQLFLDDLDFCCNFTNATVDEQGNFLLSPDHYLELYIDPKRDLFTIVEYSDDVVQQFDYTFVVFDYEPTINNSNKLVIVRTGLLTDLGNSDNKLLFRYAFHDANTYLVMEVNSMNGISQYVFIPMNQLNGNM